MLSANFTGYKLNNDKSESHLSDISTKSGYVSTMLRNQIIDREKTAFGEMRVAEMTPILQIYNPYDEYSSRIVNDQSSGTGASVGSSDGRFELQSGTDNGGYAIMSSVRHHKYRPGQGLVMRMTPIFNTGVANSEQLAGFGIIGNGIFFGYNGTSFGILLRSGGIEEVRRLEVTTAENSTTTAVVTLDDVAFNVDLTDAGGDINFTAHEIAQGTYTGWEAHQEGEFVYFIKQDTDASNGTYSYSNGGGASAVTITQAKEAVQETDTWTAQSDWNRDTFDGNGGSGVTLDPTLGNVYEITYQWLGFGMLRFSIEDPSTGRFVKVHEIEYANTSQSLSVRKPSLRAWFECRSKGSTTNITMYVGSIGTFLEGREDFTYLNRWGVESGEKSILANTETVIMTLTNRNVYNGFENESRIIFDRISVAVAGNKACVMKIYQDADVGSGVTSDHTDFALIDEFCIASYDVTATSLSSGFLVDSFVVQGNGSTEVTPYIILERGQTISVTAESTNTSDVRVAFSWLDDK